MSFYYVNVRIITEPNKFDCVTILKYMYANPCQFAIIMPSFTISNKFHQVSLSFIMINYKYGLPHTICYKVDADYFISIQISFTFNINLHTLPSVSKNQFMPDGMLIVL